MTFSDWIHEIAIDPYNRLTWDVSATGAYEALVVAAASLSPNVLESFVVRQWT